MQLRLLAQTQAGTPDHRQRPPDYKQWFPNKAEWASNRKFGAGGAVKQQLFSR